MNNIDRIGPITVGESDPTAYRLDFGPYKGYTLREIYRTDPAYVRKLAREQRGNLPEADKLAELLEGEPVRTTQIGMREKVIFFLLMIAISICILVVLLGL